MNLEWVLEDLLINSVGISDILNILIYNYSYDFL